jgi:hypothetical protein
MQRYDLLTNKKVHINKEANRFAVAIPMLTKQVSVMRPIESKSNGWHVFKGKIIFKITWEERKMEEFINKKEDIKRWE